MATSMLLASAVSAAIVTAPVINVQPIVSSEHVQVPRNVCTQVPTYHSGSNNGSIVGGIIGGVIGSEVGRDSSNRAALTGIGVLIGSQMGQANNTPPSYGSTTHCGVQYTSEYVQRVSSYQVTYQLDGVNYTTVMSYHPGSHVTVQRSHSVR